MSSAWKELIKKHSLTQKPQLSHGLANHNEDRELALTYNKLSDLEDDCKRLCKEVGFGVFNFVTKINELLCLCFFNCQGAVRYLKFQFQGFEN